MAKETMSYKEAKERLEEILALLENGELDVDALTKNIKEATGLIKFCKEMLRATEEKVNEQLSK